MKSPPAERLDKSVLHRFLRYCRTSKIDAGTMIIKAAEIPDRLYYLVEGAVEVIIEDDTGHDMVLAYLNTGHFFGELGFFDSDQQTRSAWVRARTDCVIAEMAYTDFRQLAEENHGLVIELTTQMALRLFGTDSKLGDLAFLDVKGRVAHALLDLCQEPDATRLEQGWCISITRPQLARIVGCSREMVCRVLKMLTADGLVFDSDQGIVVRVESQVSATPACA